MQLASDQLFHLEKFMKSRSNKSPSHNEAERLEVCKHELVLIFTWRVSYFSHISCVEPEIWYEVALRSALWFIQAAETPFLYGERYPLPRDTQTVMCSFRLACQVLFNWLARLERRYQCSALLIRIWRGSHVLQFISTSADSLRIRDFL